MQAVVLQSGKKRRINSQTFHAQGFFLKEQNESFAADAGVVPEMEAKSRTHDLFEGRLVFVPLDRRDE